MASAAEQLARNLSFATFSKAKALQQRIWFTLGALLVYRLGTYIPVPGIDPDAYATQFQQAQQGIAGMFDMFAGGAVQRRAMRRNGCRSRPLYSAAVSRCTSC
ncbi:MAG: preprotein translocase subunit SecY, partial [Devosia sp.]